MVTKGWITGDFTAETDNKLVDFTSYWEKIRQHNIFSFLSTGLIPSSVRMSSVRIAINPKMSELKEAVLKLRLCKQTIKRIT